MFGIIPVFWRNEPETRFDRTAWPTWQSQHLEFCLMTSGPVLGGGPYLLVESGLAKSLAASCCTRKPLRASRGSGRSRHTLGALHQPLIAATVRRASKQWRISRRGGGCLLILCRHCRISSGSLKGIIARLAFPKVPHAVLINVFRPMRHKQVFAALGAIHHWTTKRHVGRSSN